jgi:hypothetical protein
MLKSRAIIIYALIACLALIVSCSDGGSSSPSHTVNDESVTDAISLWMGGSLEAALMPTASAYTTLNSGVTTYTFVNYTDTTNYPGITMNGSFTENATYMVNGTLTYTGMDVVSLTFTNLIMTSGSESGTMTFTFTDGTSWVLNYATQTFSQA